MQRFNEIDGLRGIAALMVALLHFDIATSITNNTFINNSWLFVDFFFVLSGFIVSYNYTSRITNVFSFFSFIALRVGRLWPLHIFILLLYVGVEVLIWFLLSVGFINIPFEPFTGARYIGGIFFEILFLHALPFIPDTSWNSPSWSISVEFVTYLIFATLIISLKRINIIVYFCLILATMYIVYNSTDGIESAHEVAIYRCIYGFFTGVLLFHFYEKFKLQSMHARLLNKQWLADSVEVIALLLVTLFLIYSQHLQITILAPFLFAIATWPFLFGKGRISKILRLKMFTSLGDLSYAIYMVHSFLFSILNFSMQVVFKEYFDRNGLIYTFNFFENSDYNIGFGNVILIIVLVLLLLFSRLVNVLVEVPCREGMKNYIRNLKARQ